MISNLEIVPCGEGYIVFIRYVGKDYEQGYAEVEHAIQDRKQLLSMLPFLLASHGRAVPRERPA